MLPWKTFNLLEAVEAANAVPHGSPKHDLLRDAVSPGAVFTHRQPSSKTKRREHMLSREGVAHALLRVMYKALHDNCAVCETFRHWSFHLQR